MNQVKHNYDRLLLVLATLGLTASAGVLFTKARNLDQLFAGLDKSVVHTSVDPASDLQAFKAISEKIDRPDTWRKRMVGDQELPLFFVPPLILEFPSKKPISFKDC